MKLKLSVLVAGALTLLALSLLFIAPSAVAQTVPTETPAAPAAPVTLTVTGVITNGTAGGVNPAGGLVVNVHTFDPNDNTGNVTTLTTTLSADGTFVFQNVPSQAGWELAVSTHYQDVLYSSQITTVAAGQTTANLPVTVYETTTATTGVIVEQMHIFFDFSGSGTISVLELFIVSNTGDRAVVNPISGTVEFVLPAGATGLQVQGEIEGMDYVRTAQGFAETHAIAPGSGTGQILASFSLPYPGQMSFDQKMLYPVAAAGVLVPEGSVKFTGSQFVDEGLQNMQNTPYRIFGITNMKAGDSLAFQLAGQPNATADATAVAAAAPGAAAAALPGGSAAQTGLDAKTSIGIGVGVLGIVVVVIGVWFYRRQTGQGAAPASRLSQDELMQAVADLDDAFENGGIEELEYKRLRAKLKAQLVARMVGEK